jgi:catechol 2,3-dioxygenase-like lactoylglutathione lyase family enzyme
MFVWTHIHALEETMALENIISTTVFVRDQNTALDFYVNSLGLEKIIDSPSDSGSRIIYVAPRGTRTGILLQLPKSDEESARIGSFTGIVFGSRDVESTCQALQERGVYFIEPPTRHELDAKKSRAIFSDLDGNLFVVSKI